LQLAKKMKLSALFVLALICAAAFVGSAQAAFPWSTTSDLEYTSSSLKYDSRDGGRRSMMQDDDDYGMDRRPVKYVAAAPPVITSYGTGAWAGAIALVIVTIVIVAIVFCCCAIGCVWFNNWNGGRGGNRRCKDHGRKNCGQCGR
jgi:hypothetical protein